MKCNKILVKISMKNYVLNQTDWPVKWFWLLIFREFSLNFSTLILQKIFFITVFILLNFKRSWLTIRQWIKIPEYSSPYATYIFKPFKSAPLVMNQWMGNCYCIPVSPQGDIKQIIAQSSMRI